MLPPALGGLRFRVPPVPGRHAPGSMEKINVVRFPQDDVIILHPPFRRQIAKVKNQARRNEIMVRTISRHICRVGKRSARSAAPTRTARRICRAETEGVFRRNAISRESPVHQRQVGGLEPTVARGNRRLSVVRAVHEPTRSESEGERKRRKRPDFDASSFCRET